MVHPRYTLYAGRRQPWGSGLRISAKADKHHKPNLRQRPMGPKMEPALIAVRGEPLVGQRRGRVGRLGEKEKSGLARGPSVSAGEGARAYASVKPVIPCNEFETRCGGECGACFVP